MKKLISVISALTCWVGIGVAHATEGWIFSVNVADSEAINTYDTQQTYQTLNNIILLKRITWI